MATPDRSTPSDAFKTFQASMVMDYEKWHDGIGYDLTAFDAMTPEEQKQVLAEARARKGSDWRDVELLEHAGSDAHAVAEAMEGKSPQARMKAIGSLAGS